MGSTSFDGKNGSRDERKRISINTHHAQSTSFQELPDGLGVLPEPLCQQTQIPHNQPFPFPHFPLVCNVYPRFRQEGQGKIFSEEWDKTLWRVVVVWLWHTGWQLCAIGRDKKLAVTGCGGWKSWGWFDGSCERLAARRGRE